MESSQPDAPVEIRIGRKIFVLTVEQAREVANGILSVIDRLNKKQDSEIR